MSTKQQLPIAIIGAGPIGLAAAAHLSLRKQTFIIFESGKRIADSVETWSHVPMFSPWKFNCDAAAKKLLGQYGWSMPNEDHLPTGRELIDKYLTPLANTPEITPFIRLNSKVMAISRQRVNKMRNAGRDEAPFVLQIKSDKGLDHTYARAVIDASGTWKNPNPSGANGLPAIGESLLGERIYYGIPDIKGGHQGKYMGKNIAVIGGGHSAINSLLELADLKKEAPQMALHWVLTKADVQDAYGGLDQDELPGRGRVGERIRELVESGNILSHTPFFTDQFNRVADGIEIIGQSTNGEERLLVDEVITATGLRPDLGMLRELRLRIDQTVESPVKLAPLIDPNIHSCGSVTPHGEATLRQPEKDFYIVGMKSYGRAPTFLLATGYEQVRSVTAALCGDWESARKLDLKLPETGVCGPPKQVDPNQLNKSMQDAKPSCC